MADTVALCYCGGCNPHYDRIGLVTRLARQFPGLCFVPFSGPGTHLLAAVVVCGCTAACAGQRDLPGDVPRLVLVSAEELENASAFLCELNKES